MCLAACGVWRLACTSCMQSALPYIAYNVLPCLLGCSPPRPALLLSLLFLKPFL